MIAPTPDEQTALAAEIAADPAPPIDLTLAELDTFTDEWEIARAASFADLAAYALAWDRDAAQLAAAAQDA